VAAPGQSFLLNRAGKAENKGAQYQEEHESGLFVAGRLVLNLWRRMRAELKLLNYSYDNVAAHLLGRTVPCFSPSQLTRWLKVSYIV